MSSRHIRVFAVLALGLIGSASAATKSVKFTKTGTGTLTLTPSYSALTVAGSPGSLPLHTILSAVAVRLNLTLPTPDTNTRIESPVISPLFINGVVAGMNSLQLSRAALLDPEQPRVITPPDLTAPPEVPTTPTNPLEPTPGGTTTITIPPTTTLITVDGPITGSPILTIPPITITPPITIGVPITGTPVITTPITIISLPIVPLIPDPVILNPDSGPMTLILNSGTLTLSMPTLATPVVLKGGLDPSDPGTAFTDGDTSAVDTDAGASIPVGSTIRLVASIISPTVGTIKNATSGALNLKRNSNGELVLSQPTPAAP